MENIIIKTFQDTKNNESKKKIFLGLHCNSYDYTERKIYDFKISKKHHWDDYNVFIKDNDYLEKLYDRLLESLSTSLNKFHACKKSKLYWEMILGPWLIYFCTNIFDRWKNIEQLSPNKSFSTEINGSLKKFLISNDIQEYKTVLTSETYNHYIFSKILIFLKDKEKIKIEFFKTNRNFDDDIPIRIKKKSNKKVIFKTFIRNFIIKMFKFLTINQKILISRNYLSAIQNLKINLRLFQIPALYPIDINFQSLPNNKKRENFIFSFEHKNLFENFLAHELINHLPKVFMEKFDSMNKFVENSNLSKKPKLIFLTNFFSNTFLSFYCAKKREDGSKLILSQHGGCYGQYDRHWSENFEIKISNKFLTYGWENLKYENKTYPFGIIKNINLSYGKNFKNNDKLLFIVRSRSKFINKLDSSARSNQSYDYLNNCYDFLHRLNKSLKGKTLVRLRDNDLGWAEHPRFLKEFPNLEYDFGVNNIFKLMDSSRIVVSTSLSTSYLESLMMNIPTVVISNYNLEPMRKDAKEYLNLLIQSKILHFSPESAAKHIEQVWENIDDWWLSKHVQENINNFCLKYAKKVKNIEKEIIKIINLNINVQ